MSACFDRKFGKKFVVFKATSERHYDIKNERRIYRVYSGWCARCRHLMSFSLITPHLCFHVLYFRRHLDCAGRSQTLRGTAPWCTGLRIASRRIWTAADVELNRKRTQKVFEDVLNISVLVFFSPYDGSMVLSICSGSYSLFCRTSFCHHANRSWPSR